MKKWLAKRFGFWGGSRPSIEYYATGVSSDVVTADVNTALNLSAIWAAVSTKAEAARVVSGFVYARQERGKTRAREHPIYSLVHDRPNPYMTAATFRAVLAGQLAFHGNAFALIERDIDSRAVALWPVDSKRVTTRSNNGAIVYEVAGVEGAFMPHEIIHVKGLTLDGIVGESPITRLASSITNVTNTEKFAREYFSNNASMGSVLSHPTSLSKEARIELKTQLEDFKGGGSRRFGPLVLQEGMSFQQLSLDAEKAQLLGARQFNLTEISRAFGVHPYYLGDVTVTAPAAEEFVTRSVLPFLVELEAELTAKLFREDEQGQYIVEYDFNTLLRTDIVKRYQAYQIGRNAKILSPNDCREIENLNPYEGGDNYDSPLASNTLDKSGATNGDQQPIK